MYNYIFTKIKYYCINKDYLIRVLFILLKVPKSSLKCENSILFPNYICIFSTLYKIK